MFYKGVGAQAELFLSESQLQHQERKEQLAAWRAKEEERVRDAKRINKERERERETFNILQSRQGMIVEAENE